MKLSPYTLITTVVLAVFFLPMGTYSQTHSMSPTADNAETTPEIQAPPKISDVKKSSKIQKLLPQGSIINGKDAKLLKLPEENRWFMILVQQESNPEEISSAASTEKAYSWWEKLNIDGNHADPLSRPIEILPNQTLMTMVNILGNRNDCSVTFRVWGEITTYKGRNYILINDVGMLRLFGSVNDSPAGQSEKIAPDDLLSADTIPSGRLSPNASEQDFLPEKLRKALMSIPRPLPVGEEQETLTETQATETKPSQIPTRISSIERETESDPSVASLGWRDGELIIDRVGHLMYARDQNEWLFSPNSGSPNKPDDPLILLPNLLLEAMEKLWAQSNHRALFRISGMVTVYHGRGYFLLSKLQVVYNQGNLQP